MNLQDQFGAHVIAQMQNTIVPSELDDCEEFSCSWHTCPDNYGCTFTFSCASFTCEDTFACVSAPFGCDPYFDCVTGFGCTPDYDCKQNFGSCGG